MDKTNSANGTIAPLHVIAGAGQIGPMIARRLLARGLRVRMIRRGSFSGVPAGVETMQANMSDRASAVEAMRGASVVYNCANPAYHKWSKELLPVTRGVLDGAAAAGARLVVLDNLYMYGVPSDGRLSEDTPVAPRSKKGALRAQAADVLLQADRRGDVKVAIARAADWVGPGSVTSFFGERFWSKLYAGKPVEVLGDVDLPRSYSYTSDVADGLVTLGLAGESAFGRVWHLPVTPVQTTRAWIDRFAAGVGVPARMMKLSPFLLRIAGLFIPAAGELPEMIYQWQAPFIVDDSRFRATFEQTATPFDTCVKDTLAWAKDAHAPANKAKA